MEEALEESEKQMSEEESEEYNLWYITKREAISLINETGRIGKFFLLSDNFYSVINHTSKNMVFTESPKPINNLEKLIEDARKDPNLLGFVSITESGGEQLKNKYGMRQDPFDQKQDYLFN